MRDYSDKEWRGRSLDVDCLPFLKYKGVVNIIKTFAEIKLDKIIVLFLTVRIIA